MFLNCKNAMFLSCIKHMETNSKFLSKGTNIFCLKTRAEILFNYQLFLTWWSLKSFSFFFCHSEILFSFRFRCSGRFLIFSRISIFLIYILLSRIPLFHYFIRILRLLPSNSARYRKPESIRFISWAPLYVLHHRLCCYFHFSHCVLLPFPF